MEPTYKKVHEYIRSVDNDTIVFFEPATGGNFLDAWPVGFEEGPGGKDYNDRQALSYHIYCLIIDRAKATDFFQYIIANLSVLTCDIMDDAMYNIRRDDVNRLNLAGFLTEFGNAGDGVAAEDVINFATRKMDEFMHGWTYWYITPDPKVKNSTVIRALARPFPHKVSGIPILYSYDPRTQIFKLEYKPCINKPCVDYPTEVFTSKNYAYAGGMQYFVDTECVVKSYVNNTLQMLYIQSEDVTSSCSIKLMITPGTK